MDFVRNYLVELQQWQPRQAFHSLIEADPAIIPLRIAEFSPESDVAFRSELLRVIAEFRSADTIPFLRRAALRCALEASVGFLVAR